MNVRQEHQVILDSPIGLGKIIDAVDGLKPNKSPGTDGLIGKFYKKN